MMKMVRTLQELCEIRAAISLSTDPAVKEVIFATSQHLDVSTEMKNIGKSLCWYDTFLKEISDLTKEGPLMPNNKLYDLVPVISLEILKWARFHYETFNLSYDFTKGFINNSLFTKEGTVDREKAARAVFEDESLKPSTRFKIVSYYSLSDIIMKSWLLVPVSKMSFLRYYDNNAAVRLWTDYLLGYYRGTNLSLDLLISAVDHGNEISFYNNWRNLDEETKTEAANYFAQTFHKKVKQRKRYRKNVDYIYTFEPYINIFKFLVKNFDIEILKSLLIDYCNLSYWVLTNMLNWPYQSSFLDTVKLLKETLSNNGRYCLLQDIIVKIDDPLVGKSYDYRGLFQNFWKEIPFTFKIYFFALSVHDIVNARDLYCGSDYHQRSNPSSLHVFAELFKLDFTEVEEIIRSILRGIEKLKIFTNKYAYDICNEAIAVGNFKCADLFLECCRVDLIVFKKNIIKTIKFQETLGKLLVEFKLDEIDRVLKWVLTPDKFKIFKDKFSAWMSENLDLKLEENLITILKKDDESNIKLVIDVNDFTIKFRLPN